ncbi:MAG: endolytic transglycosylase MltG, partial [Candidatus Moranbacteria bacterium]|nr:endolytic transglycosylase MltG [Candidatus Moranbacteria bacterium]
VVFIVASLGVAYYLLFSAPQKDATEDVFIVNKKQTKEQTLDKLKSQGFIRNKAAFKFILDIKNKDSEIEAGGYRMSKNMNVWKVASKITERADMKWVTIPEGYRKEQTGEVLADSLGWNEEELDKWNTVYTKMNVEYLEGTYFPDTYLIPVGENGLDTAKRMTRRFDEQFAPYIGEFAQQNILWTTGLRLASIIQREAAGKSDMPLIAGIMWNRLNQEMNLEIDATVQYARGKTENGWWAPIKAEDITNIDSPYNTYKYKGLPPHPICNPGLEAIKAVLYPEETECLFYLHDNDRQIHCAKTYEEHKENIEKFL